MAKQRKTKEPKSAADIKLKQPDRSGPSDKTLLDLAQGKDLFSQAEERRKELAKERGEVVEERRAEDDEEERNVLSPGADRFMEAMLYTVSLSTLHLTFDILVQKQYGKEMDYRDVAIRTARAWVVFLILFWPLHPHEANPTLLPGFPRKYQQPLRQTVFGIMSAVSGCYLIHISNNYDYLAVMKQAPPVGCLWLWAVIELELVNAVLSLIIAGGYLWYHDYKVY
ncbi:unnamed protein product [Clonostachys solani]|uniref:DUF7719 domain-containing protein n=1 Tax=Clonostachys solani TaxID=160281 RepID=A0A9N9YWG0_9HYPO|nr:unnamed protein product [Clonostachys solani]